MRRRVLVTRPQPGADATARRLEALGFDAVVLPLTEIRSLPVSSMPSPDITQAVAATSANALRHAPARLLAGFTGKPCFVVGQETRTAARNAGFENPFIGAGDAQSLARAVIDASEPNARILYLCGKVRRHAVETLLADAGLTVQPVETYDTVEIEHSGDTMLHALDNTPPDAVLIYSAVAAKAAARLIGREDVRHLFTASRLLCLSRRIADDVGNPGEDRLFSATEPSEDALMALLVRLCGNTP